MIETVARFPREVEPPPPEPPGKGWMQRFVWRDPATIPRRRWIYGQHYVRRFISTTVSPGGIGKSALTITEALAMVTGRDLVGVRPDEPGLKVWLWGGEDPLEETERRIAAAVIHYGLDPEVVAAGLFIGSGRDADLVIAETTRDGTEILAPNVEALRRLFLENRIDVAVVDPFVASHRVPENDNGAIDRVAKTWAKLADETNTAIELVHHARKGTPGVETGVEDGRGAVALLAAARSARLLNAMTEQEATNAGVERRRSYFRVTNGKANLAPPPEGSSWFRFLGVDLGNGDGMTAGDNVGVVTAWTWPDHFAGLQVEDLIRVQAKVGSGDWRAHMNSPDWVGYAVAAVLGLDADDKCAKARIAALVKTWLANGALTIEKRRDGKGNDRPWVIVGTPATLEVETSA